MTRKVAGSATDEQPETQLTLAVPETATEPLTGWVTAEPSTRTVPAMWTALAMWATLVTQAPA